MTIIKVQIRDRTARVLNERARRYGLPPEQFVAVSIENLVDRPDPEFHDAARRVLSKKRRVYRPPP